LPAVQYPNAGQFLTLSVNANSNPLTSTQFQTLSDQSGISEGLPPSPAPPLNGNPSTINMFLVNTLMPVTPPGGTLYGFSWINNNGVAIAANSLSPVSGRPDTVAHELGHNLGLNHMDQFNPGDTRTLSSLGTVLNNLKSGAADQLNALQTGRVLDPSGFVNPIPEVDARVVAPGSSPGPFTVGFVAPGRPGEFLLKLTLAAPEGVLFEPGTFAVTSGSTGVPGNVTCEALCSGSSITLDFTKGTFVNGATLGYTIAVCQQNSEGCTSGRPDLLLAGGTYTFEFETDNGSGTPVEQFQTTSQLAEAGDDIADLTASSQLPDLMIPSEILNPTTFVGFTTIPCTATDGTCPPLMLADADPAEDNPPVPEPPSIAIMLAGLLAIPGLHWWMLRRVPIQYLKPIPSQ
jgi:hypothetical protein